MRTNIIRSIRNVVHKISCVNDVERKKEIHNGAACATPLQSPSVTSSSDLDSWYDGVAFPLSLRAFTGRSYGGRE